MSMHLFQDLIDYTFKDESIKRERDVSVTEGGGRMVILCGSPPFIVSGAGQSGGPQLPPSLSSSLPSLLPLSSDI